MCGIAGWTEKDSKMTERGKILKEMSETLERRGPDENGLYINGDCALIHRRLAVIDFENGKQPMTARHKDANYVRKAAGNTGSRPGSHRSPARSG